ncbi:hypothetical protein [Halorubrum amylolyticum]|uniref:hypothetical protein n=1 Tax=Halorubrum amylolyticum TaxID=2508724 RepID=UPI001009301B|nr:hypothetical protein [Halorubrum amylolyticum]
MEIEQDTPGWGDTAGPSRGKEVIHSEESQVSGIVQQSGSELDLPYEDVLLWELGELEDHDDTLNVERIPPEPLFYLAKIVGIPSVTEVYLDQVHESELKIWTVLNERDYDTMDDLYEIELTVKSRFPMTSVNFRVTVDSETGPSVSEKSMRIYSTK